MLYYILNSGYKRSERYKFSQKVNTFFIGIILLLLTGLSGCTKFVQVDPPVSELVSTTVYANNLTAAAAMTSIYARMIENNSGSLSSGNTSISLEAGLTADELKNYSNNATLSHLYTNTLVSTDPSFWTEIYQEIYVANAVLEGLNSSTGVTQAVKQQLIGEAKFMRAFLHFYAVNLYGDVPIVTTTDYTANNVIKRSPILEVYGQIITDLLDAQNLLNSDYVSGDAITPTTERVRPTKWAAAALLARAYLYTGDWKDALAETDTVINNSTLFSVVSDLNSVFLANSNETIWQLQSIVPGYNTFDAYYFILTTLAPGVSPQNPVALSVNLLNAFEEGDSRRLDWIDSLTTNNKTYYYAYKYKVNYQVGNPVTEYLMVLRLAEQYLIRAEAEANGAGNGIPDAITDLNTIRARAGLLPYSGGTDQASVLSAILHERQVELFTEWGHRWFDLKRTETVNTVMGVVTPQKGGTWNADWALFPIPQSEILINSNLTQNPGY